MKNSEYCLLGIILNNPEKFKMFKQNIFSNSNCNELYNILNAEYKRSKGFTKETILEMIKDNVKLNEEIFYDIYDSAFDVNKFDSYFNFVLSEWAVRKADMAIKEIRNQKYSSIVDVKKELQNIINDLSVNDEQEIQSSQEIICDILKELGEKKNIELINSHCKYIDSFGGFERGDFVVLAARPGVGKSSMMYNLMLKDMQKKIHVGLFSLEASRKKVFRILGCIGSSVDSKLLRLGLLTEEMKSRYIEAYEKIYDTEVLTIDSVNINIESFRRKVKIMKDRNNIKKVYVDYLQLLTCDEGKTRYEQMSNISRELKKIAMENELIVFALAQLNRELEKRAEGKPRKSDLRDTGSIEQDADIIWLLYNFNETQDDEIVLGNIIDKFREGAMGEFKSNFIPSNRRISEWMN